MSRYSTPVADIGRLSIGGQYSRAKSNMPATTRSSAQRRRNLVASQQASSGAAAGPSQPSASTMQVASSSSSRKPAHKKQKQRGGTQRPRRGAGGDSDPESPGGDDDDSDDETGDQFTRRKLQLILLILTACSDTYLTPAEFRRINQRDAGVSATQFTQSLSRLATPLANLVQNGNDLASIHGAMDTSACLRQIAANMSLRVGRICNTLTSSINVTGQMTPVRDAVLSFLSLHQAIDAMITTYQASFTMDTWRGLAAALVAILRYVVDRDEDSYQASTVYRPPYANPGSGGNLYKSWMYIGEPRGFLAVLNKVDENALIGHRDQLRYCYNTMRGSVEDHNGEARRVVYDFGVILSRI